MNVPAAQPTPYPEVNAILSLLLSRMQAILAACRGDGFSPHSIYGRIAAIETSMKAVARNKGYGPQIQDG